MNYQDAFYALLAFTLVREIFFQFTTHRLINKLMSRSYFEYSQARDMKPEKSSRDQFKVQEDLPEDLGSLQEIGI